MSNPYSVVQTDGQIYRDVRGEIFKDTKGRNWRIQRLDDGRRVFWNGTNWIDVQTLQPISRTRQPQAAPQHAPQQHANVSNSYAVQTSCRVAMVKICTFQIVVP